MRNASVGFHCPSCASVSPIDKRTQRKLRSFTGDPITTRALIALNALAFIWILISGGSVSSGGGVSFEDYGLFGPFIAEGEWWRLFTSAFLHSGLLHFAVNMYLLWVLGQQLERLHGRSRYLGLYFGSLVAGSLGVMLLDPTALTVGASGAVFGLMSATFIHQKRRGISPWRSGIGGLLILNLIFTFGRSGISIGGHLGGLLGGACLAWAIEEIDRKRLNRNLGLAVITTFTLLCLVAGIWAGNRWYDPVLG